MARAARTMMVEVRVELNEPLTDASRLVLWRAAATLTGDRSTVQVTAGASGIGVVVAFTMPKEAQYKVVSSIFAAFLDELVCKDIAVTFPKRERVS